jgi:uncharacterized protein YprB with RNaseH-like and TPR domain
MKVLFWDTESTDLTALFGRILCCSYVGLDGDAYTMRGDRRPYKGKSLIDDSRLVVAIRDELEKADMIVGWNTKLHDIPLLNARLQKFGERPLAHGEKSGVINLDLMWYAGGQSQKIGSKKLDNVAKFFESPNQKTAISWEAWQLAATGDKPSMDTVVEHCEYDVLVLRDLWPSLAPFVKQHKFDLSEVWPFIDQIASRKRAA